MSIFGKESHRLKCNIKNRYEKVDLAGRLLAKGVFPISAQVVGEIRNTLKRKAGPSPNEFTKVIEE